MTARVISELYYNNLYSLESPSPTFLFLHSHMHMQTHKASYFQSASLSFLTGLHWILRKSSAVFKWRSCYQFHLNKTNQLDYGNVNNPKLIIESHEKFWTKASIDGLELIMVTSCNQIDQFCELCLRVKGWTVKNRCRFKGIDFLRVSKIFLLTLAMLENKMGFWNSFVPTVLSF